MGVCKKCKSALIVCSECYGSGKKGDNSMCVHCKGTGEKCHVHQGNHKWKCLWLTAYLWNGGFSAKSKLCASKKVKR